MRRRSGLSGECMKAPAFKYLRPESLDGVFAAFTEYGDEALILAGGQSLMPTLNMRLAQPAVLIDINHIPALNGVEQSGDGVSIGATTRHVDVMHSELVASELPLIGCAIKHVAHRGVRNRGPFGGSLAHADPAAEMAACAVALDATLVLDSKAGARRVAATDFFQGVMTTDRRSDEILTAVEFPPAVPDDVWAFRELSRRHGDFALVGVAVKARRSSAGFEDLRLVVFGCEERPRVSEIAASMVPSCTDPMEIVAAIAGELDPMSDLSGDAETKKFQAHTLIQRCLEDMFEGRLDG